ncbi:MAG TPA: cell envelope integrity protein TolA, partial [Beijerinckiaceae bacterium]|nr:cell envelope integrity protein TolA [Beijerinckiaceae bacterium]
APPKPEPVAVPPKPAMPKAQPDEEDEDEAELIRQKQLKQKEAEQKAEEARKAEEKRKAEEARKAEEKRKADEARRLAEDKRKAEEKAELEEARKLAAEQEKAEEKKRLADEAAKKAAEAARKAAEAKKAEEARKAAEKAESDKLNAAIRNRLLASRDAPASSGSTGPQVTRTASAGAPNATGARLSPSDREALMGLIKEQMERCWSVSGMSNPTVKPLVRLQLTPSGAISVQPALVNNSADPAFRAIADSGMRAIRACAPYRIPSKFADKFEDWKTITVKLDPSDLL